MCATVAWCATTAGHFDDGPEFDRTYLPEGPLSNPPVCTAPSDRSTPMRRAGERGGGEFERISWDEAIAEIAEKWKGYTEEFARKSTPCSWAAANTGTWRRRPEGSIMARR